MKTLVVGASGTLGPQVARLLKDRGHQVVGTATSESSQRRVESLGVEAALLDLLDAEATEAVCARHKPEAIVNLATRIPPAGPRRYRDMAPTNELRRQGTTNLLIAARAAGVRRYVSESMIFVYGYGVHTESVSESAPPAREQRRGLQAATDAIASSEAQIRALSDSGELEGVSLRFGLFHSPESAATREMAELAKRRRLPLIGGGRALHSWIALEDAAQAVAVALETRSPQPVYNVVDDQPVRFADYLGELVKAVGAKAPPSVPAWVARPFAPYAVAFLADVQLPVSNALLREDLGWRPTLPSYREVLELLSDDSAGVAPRAPGAQDGRP